MREKEEEELMGLVKRNKKRKEGEGEREREKEKEIEEELMAVVREEGEEKKLY